MSNAKIDENDNGTLTGYNETTGLVEPVRVDPTFGYVEIFVVADTGGTFTPIPNAKIDENDNGTLTGYNETTGLIEALRCDSGGALVAKSV